MATVPNIRTWTNEDVTAAKMQEISDMLAFLKGNLGGICFVRATAQQNGLANTTDVPIQFGAQDANSVDNMWTGGSHVTAKTAGWYLMSGLVAFQANANGARFGKFKKNGVTLRAASVAAAAGGIEVFLDVGCMITYMNVNDYLELTVWQNAGPGAVGTSVNDGGSQFSVVRIAS